MVIDEQAVLNVAIAKNFDLELFSKYLSYQKETRDYYPGKWTVEEYAASMLIKDPTIDCFTHERLEWFGNWMGFGGEHYIPDCLSFLRYCACRDVFPYNDDLDEIFIRALEKEEN